MPELRPRRFDLIAFDWDGTLFDSTAIIMRSIQDAVRDVGGAVPASDEAAAWVIGMALEPALAHAAPDVPRRRFAPQLANRYRHHYLKRQDDVTLFAGVPACWHALRARPPAGRGDGQNRRGLGRRCRNAGAAARHVRRLAHGRRNGRQAPADAAGADGRVRRGARRLLMIGDTTHDLPDGPRRRLRQRGRGLWRP